jgi:hypothetical protein
MAITLDATTKSIDLTTSSTADIDYAVSFVDMTTTAFTPGDGHGTINTAGTTVIVAAPASSTQRGVKSISIFNRHASTANTVTVKKDVSGTEYILFQAQLSPNESLQWNDGGEWVVFDEAGRRKTSVPQDVAIRGRIMPIFKSGTASDATGYWYSYWKDTGFPGAWSPGTPGTNGRVTNGTTAADAGSLPIWTPTGNLYVSKASLNSSVLHSFWVFDVLWVNTGLSVTTTTAQSFTMPTLPARDFNGTTNGEGCMVGLVTTTNNTNGAAINNSTISYTNSDGTAGRTGTLVNIAGENIPATPVIGTVVWFSLAAGDNGVRSVQSITLGTSLGGGAVSLIVARPIVQISPALANVATNFDYDAPGIRIYNGSTLLLFAKTSATTATSVNGSLVITER